MTDPVIKTHTIIHRPGYAPRYVTVIKPDYAQIAAGEFLRLEIPEILRNHLPLYAQIVERHRERQKALGLL